jgi:hypothetical protein
MTPTTPADLNEAVVLRRELLARGQTDQQIRRMLKDKVLVRIRHGAYIDAGLWADLSPADRHRALIRAVLKRAHPATVVTHISAAVERGMPVWGISLEEVHTTRTDGKTGRREAGVRHHRGALPEDQVEIIHGVPVSTAARCGVEIMTLTTVEPALVTINAMLHAGVLTKEQLAEMTSVCKHWPETLTSHLVLRLCDAAIESVGESRAWFMCWEQGLPCPVPQVEVHDETGALIARLDFAWPEFGVWMEFDGREKYKRYRRDGETLEEFLMREKAREEQVSQLTGWTCIRISWADLQHPAALANRIRRILESRRPIGA